MNKGKKIGASKYRQIKAAILEAKRNNKWDAVAVGKKFGYSASTIRAVAASKSWPKFQAEKAAYNERRIAKRAAATTSPEAGEKGPEPITPRQQPVINGSIPTGPTVEEQLATALEELKARPSREEFEHEVRSIHERQDVLYGAIRVVLKSVFSRIALGGREKQIRTISNLATDNATARNRSKVLN